MSAVLLNKLSEADRAIGRLDGITMMLPEKSLFLYMYLLPQRRLLVIERDLTRKLMNIE